MLKAIVLLCFFLQLVTCQIYLDCNEGSDENNCLASTSPCKSLQKALNLVTGTNDEILVLSGICTLSELVLVQLNVSISSFDSQNPATFSQGGLQIGWSNARVNVSLFGLIFTEMKATTQMGGAISVVSNAHLHVENCTFSNSTSSKGGCIYIDMNSNCTIKDSKFLDSYATYGGAIYNVGSLRIFSSYFKNCLATLGGGIYYANPSSTHRYSVNDSVFDHCRANSEGGAVWVSQNLVFYSSNNTFQSCSALSEGGGLACMGICSVNNSRFYNCHSSENGGAMTGYFSAFNSEFGGNHVTSNGGALIFIDTSGYVTNCSFWNNTAGTAGGAVCVSSNSNIKFLNCSFDDNFSPYGGSFYIDLHSVASIQECHFEDNIAGRAGAAIYCSNSKLKISHCTFDDNFDKNTTKSDDLFCSTFPSFTYCQVDSDNSVTVSADCSPKSFSSSSKMPFPVVAIVGIVLGGVGLLIIVALLIYAFTCMKKNKRTSIIIEEQEKLMTKQKEDYDEEK